VADPRFPDAAPQRRDAADRPSPSRLLAVLALLFAAVVLPGCSDDDPPADDPSETPDAGDSGDDDDGGDDGDADGGDIDDGSGDTPAVTGTRRLVEVHHDLDANGVDDAVETIGWDAQGRFESWRYVYSGDGETDRYDQEYIDEVWEQQLTYDADGRVDTYSWTLQGTNSVIVDKWTAYYGYDENGRIDAFRLEYYDRNGGISAIQTIEANGFSFNAKNQLTSVLTHQSTPSVPQASDTETLFENGYDDRGRVDKVGYTTVESPDLPELEGIYVPAWAMHWRDDDRLSQFDQLESDGTVWHSEIYGFDDNGRLVTELDVDVDQGDTLTRFVYDGEHIDHLDVDVGNDGSLDAVLSASWEEAACTLPNLFLIAAPGLPDRPADTDSPYVDGSGWVKLDRFCTDG